jgi:hypothetical protein
VGKGKECVGCTLGVRQGPGSDVRECDPCEGDFIPARPGLFTLIVDTKISTIYLYVNNYYCIRESVK